MMTAEQYVGQPIRSLQTMLRTIAHADETLVRLVPDGIYGPNTVPVSYTHLTLPTNSLV